MDLKVKFVYNKITGEVEVYEVDDVGESGLGVAEHNRQHDEATSQFARLLARDATFFEIDPGLAYQAEPEPAPQPDDVSGRREPERERNG